MANQSDPTDSYNRGGFIAFLFSLIFSLGFFTYIVGVHPGVDLKEIPEVAPAGEGTAAPTVNLANFDINKVEKYWETSPELVAYGQQAYKTNCAVCHGDTGVGDGPAGAALVPKPRNLIEGAWKAGGTIQAHVTTLTNGLAGTSMASFKHLPIRERFAIAHYVRSITKNAEKDDPAALETFAKAAQ